jgi:uncharacterized membrane protein
MKKITILFLAVSLICVQFLSGCQSPWTGGGATGGTMFELVIFAIIIIAILVVILLVGLARAGTHKNITIQTYPTNSEPDKEDAYRNKPTTSIAECEICGKKGNPRKMKVVTVDDKELFLCETCTKRVSSINKKESEDNVDVLKIIRVRYAKGEITKEQFEQMKKDLEK